MESRGGIQLDLQSILHSTGELEQLHWNIQQFGSQGFTPVLSTDDLETGQLVIVDTSSTADGARWKRGVVTRIMARYL